MWFKEAQKGFSAVKNACPMKKDCNTITLSGKQCFLIWMKLLIVQFLRVFAMSQRLKWQWYSASKDSWKLSFSKNNLTTRRPSIFSIFENLMKCLVSHMWYDKNISSRTWVIYKRATVKLDQPSHTLLLFLLAHLEFFLFLWEFSLSLKKVPCGISY